MLLLPGSQSFDRGASRTGRDRRAGPRTDASRVCEWIASLSVSLAWSLCLVCSAHQATNTRIWKSRVLLSIPWSVCVVHAHHVHTFCQPLSSAQPTRYAENACFATFFTVLCRRPRTLICAEIIGKRKGLRIVYSRSNRVEPTIMVRILSFHLWNGTAILIVASLTLPLHKGIPLAQCSSWSRAVL